MVKRTVSRPRPAGEVIKSPAALIAELEHPHKDAIVRLIELTQSADPRIQVGWKWNAPSFALAVHFATMHLRAKHGVMLIMHFGAKKQATLSRESIADPNGLLTWLADDRAEISFNDLAAVEANKESYVALIQAWISAIPGG